MNRLPSWVSTTCLIAALAVSGLSGVLIGHRMARRQYEVHNDPEAWNVHVAREFDRIVKPTAAQAPIIQAHLDRAVLELQSIRRDTIDRSTNVIWRLVTSVERELTPGQKVAFEAMKPQPADLTLDVLRVGPAREPGK